jgi:hypothetical protein
MPKTKAPKRKVARESTALARDRKAEIVVLGEKIFRELLNIIDGGWVEHDINDEGGKKELRTWCLNPYKVHTAMDSDMCEILDGYITQILKVLERYRNKV